MRAFQEVMTQFEGAPVREVELEQFTIEEKIDGVRSALAAREPVMFVDLFSDVHTRLELIVTLMALLELLKHGQARVEQVSSFGSIWIYRGPNFGKPLEEVSDWTADSSAPVEVAAMAPPAGDEDVDLALHAPLDPLEAEGPGERGVAEDGEPESR
jgi:hypothetical protein